MKALMLVLVLLLPAHLLAQERGTGVAKGGVLELRQIIDQSKGQVLIVNFWATWCAPCVKEFPGLMSLRREFPEEKLRIVGISVDYDVRPVENFIKQQQVNFPILLDDGSISSMMGIKNIPRTLIYDQSGKKFLDNTGFISEESFRHVVERLLNTP
jgi:thiol-disulfide isomerase/thioredoxin